MTQIYNYSAPKKPTNVSINSDLLNKARSLKLNLSATLEKALLEQVKASKQAQWRMDNKKAIGASNRFTEENGLFSDKYRIL